MSRDTEQRHGQPGSDVARLLDAAATAPVVVEKDGVRYSIERLDDDAAPPRRDNPAESVRGIKEAAGSWRDVDVDAFKAYIAERRRTSSRPAAMA